VNKIINDTPYIAESGRYIYVYTIDYSNSDYYIGYHTTTDLNDDYSGSGKKSEGVAVKRTIHKFFNSREEAGAYENQLLGKKWLNDDKCLNAMQGGCIGGIQSLPKEIVDGWRRENLYKIMEDKETWIKNCKKGGTISSAKVHKEKTPEGKSKMTATTNKRRAGKKKIRKDWDKVSPKDIKMFPRIYKRIENDYEFASAMCLPEDLNNLLDEGWYKAVSKFKGKSIHTKASKLKISKGVSK